MTFRVCKEILCFSFSMHSPVWKLIVCMRENTLTYIMMLKLKCFNNKWQILYVCLSETPHIQLFSGKTQGRVRN